MRARLSCRGFAAKWSPDLLPDRTMHRRLRLFLLTVALLVVAGCATHTKETQLEQTLNAYAATIRWGDIASSMQYIDPEVLKARPPSQLELSRFQQVKVSGYDVSGPQPVSDTEVHQRAVIGLINVHTQTERTVIDNQVWRYDPVAERWWLMSGLPQITP